MKQIFESRNHHVLTEAVWQTLNEDTRQYLNEWDQVVHLIESNRKLFEQDLTAQQINTLFQNAEKYAIGRGDMKTGLGKTASGAQAAGSAALGQVKLAANLIKQVNDKVNQLGKVIQNTTPVQNIDAAFDKAKRDLHTTLGGKDAKVVKMINSLSSYAKGHPGKAKFVVGALTTAAAIAAGPAGGAAAGFLLRSANELLKGEKLSTAAGKAAKTGAIGAVAGMALDGLADMYPGIPVSDITTDSSGAVEAKYMVDDQSFSTEEEMMAYLDAQSFDPQIEAMIDDQQVSVAEARRLADMMGLDAGGNLQFREVGGVPVEINGNPVPANLYTPEQQQMLDAVKSARAAMSTESYDSARLKHLSGIPLSEAEQLVMEAGALGAMATAAKTAGKQVGNVAKKAGGVLAKGAQAAGKELGQTITARKLGALWKNAGSPTDTASVINLLMQAGIPQDGLQAIAKASNVKVGQIPTGTVATPSQQAKKPGMVSRIGKAIGGAAASAVGMNTATQKAQNKQQASQQAHAQGSASVGQQPNQQSAKPTQDQGLDQMQRARQQLGLDQNTKPRRRVRPA